VKARKPFALEDDHAPPGAREQRSGSAASWSAANDRDIVHVSAHSFRASYREITSFASYRLTECSHRLQEKPIHLARFNNRN
jgi:hypothetical protein